MSEQLLGSALALGVVGMMWAALYVLLHRLAPAGLVPSCVRSRVRRTREVAVYVAAVSSLLLAWGVLGSL